MNRYRPISINSEGIHSRLLFKIAATLLLASPVVFARHPKIARDLDNADQSATGDVIVQFVHGPTAGGHDKVAKFGGRLKKQLNLVKGAVYSLPYGQLKKLADDEDVVSISPDHAVSAFSDQSMATIGADIARSYGYDGSGIGIAVIDSGVTKVGDTKTNGVQRIVYEESFAQGAPGVADIYGHGSHVAYIAAGNGANSSCSTCTQVFRGVATNANIINLRVLDNKGTGKDSDVIAAIQQAIALKSVYNIRVINLSLGRPVTSSYLNDPLCQAVEAAWKAGIVVVVAAGNDGRNNSEGTSGYATISAPGNDPYVITVGAMKTRESASRGDDQVASYSSKGPTLFDHIVKPDLVAPGNRIIAGFDIFANLAKTYPQNIVPLSYYGGSTAVSKYFWLSGTSMATPMVSGAAALLLQQNPNLTPDQVKARLMKTANKSFPTFSVATDPVTGATYTSYYDVFTIGAGYLDVYAALTSNVLGNGYALSPTAVYNALTNSFTLNGTAPPSGRQSIWDTNSLWDTQSIWDTQSVWGSAVLVSGTQSLWGTQSVWGSSSNPVWGSLSIWDKSTPGPESTNISIQGEQ